MNDNRSQTTTKTRCRVRCHQWPARCATRPPRVANRTDTRTHTHTPPCAHVAIHTRARARARAAPRTYTAAHTRAPRHTVGSLVRARALVRGGIRSARRTSAHTRPRHAHAHVRARALCAAAAAYLTPPGAAWNAVATAADSQLWRASPLPAHSTRARDRSSSGSGKISSSGGKLQQRPRRNGDGPAVETLERRRAAGGVATRAEQHGRSVCANGVFILLCVYSCTVNARQGVWPYPSLKRVKVAVVCVP